MPIPGNMLSAVTEMVDPNTSGWVALLNCTTTKGINGRNGDGVLTVKSIASGEVRARTVSSYDITPGVTYQTFADAAGTVVERIGLRWLTAAGVEVSITWSLTTATASTSFHRVGVAGPAPMGATRVQVVLSSTPAAALVSQFWENVYLGLPIRTTGNLLPFGTESMEIDASGWVAETNATVGRLAPAVQWAVDWYYAGGEVLTVTAVAAGNTAARTVDRPAVTVGVEYMAAAYLSPPSTGSNAWIELRFYDGSGTQLSATRGTLDPASTGFQRQVASALAPTGAVTCGVSVGMNSATLGQVLRVEQIVVSLATQAQAGSIIPYADTSFEQGVAGWTKTTGVATIGRSSPWGAFSIEGSYALTVTSTTATASTIRSAKFPAAGFGGASFRLQYTEQVTAGGWTATRGVRWYNDANTDLGLTALAATAVPTPGWWNLSYDGTAPAGATQAAVEITLTATATNSVIRIDRVALWIALPLGSVTVNQDSASITLTLRELEPDYLIRVYRVTEDGTRTLVRGPAGLYDGTVVILSDLLVIEDYEAPLGVPVSYYVELIDPDDMSVGNRSTTPVMIEHTDINRAWLKDPGNPQRGMTVVVQTGPEWQRPVDQSAYVVKGRRNKVVLSGLRQGLEGELAIWTETDDERNALHLLLDSGNLLLWQAAPGMGVSDMYVTVGQVTEGRAGGTAMVPMRTWTLPLIQADMPYTTGVNGSAGRTWVDVVAEFDTCDDLLAVYATCEDLLLDRRIAS